MLALVKHLVITYISEKVIPSVFCDTCTCTPAGAVQDGAVCLHDDVLGRIVPLED
jgi:hypothetical protein